MKIPRLSASKIKDLISALLRYFCYKNKKADFAVVPIGITSSVSKTESGGAWSCAFFLYYSAPQGKRNLCGEAQ